MKKEFKSTDGIAAEIGRRIKHKRLEAGLTQSALCGDYITRNMLSRIETGAAVPSLDTLIFLSDRLDTSPAFFLCRDESEAAQYDKANMIGNLRGLVKKKCYDKAADLATSENDDEIALLKAVSEAHCALSDIGRAASDSAKIHITAALSAIEHSVYRTEALASELQLLLGICRYLDGEDLPTPHDVSQAGCHVIGAELHTYILALSVCEHTKTSDDNLTCLLSEGSTYREYLEAKKLVLLKQYAEALPGLIGIITKNADALVTFSAMKDAELCFYETGSYKEAYEMSKKHLHANT